MVPCRIAFDVPLLASVEDGIVAGNHATSAPNPGQYHQIIAATKLPRIERQALSHPNFRFLSSVLRLQTVEASQPGFQLAGL